MGVRTKKMAVLHQVGQEAEPISLKELLKKLGSSYAERSVRRWLSEMTTEGLIEKVGNKRATKYKVIQRANRHETNISNCFGSESKKTLEKVRHPIYERIPIPYVDEWFDSYKPNVTYYIRKREINPSFSR